MENRKTTHLDDEKAEPLGDTGDGETGVPDSEQGISNRAGDKADDDEEFDEDSRRARRAGKFRGRFEDAGLNQSIVRKTGAQRQFRCRRASQLSFLGVHVVVCQPCGALV